MIREKESFIISGSRELIFRMEDGKIHVYDPYDLLAYELNDVAAEILIHLK